MDVVVSEQPTGQATVIRLAGQLDIDSAPMLRATVEEMLERSVNRIVVDLGELDFCDSIGLSTFVLAHQSCAEGGGYLRLAAPSPFLLRVLTTVGLRGKLPVYRGVDEACAGDKAGLLPGG
jgi:anti-sigma B factor antagonist